MKQKILQFMDKYRDYMITINTVGLVVAILILVRINAQNHVIMQSNELQLKNQAELLKLNENSFTKKVIDSLLNANK